MEVANNARMKTAKDFKRWKVRIGLKRNRENLYTIAQKNDSSVTIS
jgi:hypothetical protein